jgi:hypothetical protein
VIDSAERACYGAIVLMKHFIGVAVLMVLALAVKFLLSPRGAK